MAVGQQQAPLSIPSPSELAGGPVTPAVTPSSVAQMSEALRQGFLTADDIIARTGKRAQLREKADVMSLTEQMSPEAVQARRAGLTESLARSQLGAAQAQANLPLVQPTAQLAQSQLEIQAAYQKYPAAKLFDQHAPVIGIAEPMTPDKQIDWSKKASIGIQIAEHLRLQNEAKEKLANIRSEKSADGSVISAFTLQGIPVDSAEVQRLESQARSPFKLITPGTVQISSPATVTTPAVEPIGASPELASKWRAQLINEGVANAVAMSDEQVGQLMQTRRQAQFEVQPSASAALAAAAPAARPAIEVAPSTPPIGTPVGGGFSLGPPKSASATSALSHYTETQQKALGALTRGLVTEATLLNKSAAATGFNPASFKSQTRMEAYKGGLFSQMFANITGITENERAYANAADNWVQGLLRAESGAAIATKEQAWYERTFFPALGDTPAIQAQKDGFRNALMKTFEQVVDGKMTAEEYTAFRDMIASQAVTPGSSSPSAGGTGKVKDIPGIGKIQRRADGQYYPVR